MLLHPFLTFIHSCAQVSWVLALNVPEGAERKLEISQFFFVSFQEAACRFWVTMSLSDIVCQRLCDSFLCSGALTIVHMRSYTLTLALALNLTVWHQSHICSIRGQHENLFHVAIEGMW